MVGLSHKDDYFETPDWLFKDIVKQTGLWITTDLCASDDNSKCDGFIDEEMNVLNRTAVSFKDHPRDEAYFCNPPRSKNGKFVDFVYNEIWNNGKFDD